MAEQEETLEGRFESSAPHLKASTATNALLPSNISKNCAVWHYGARLVNMRYGSSAVEYEAKNLGVVGSIPTRRTQISKDADSNKKISFAT